MESTIVETTRLQMRRMTNDDVAALLSIFGDAEVMRFYTAPFDCQRMQEWVDWNQRSYTKCGYGLWALILRNPEVEIGYHIRRDLWRQGLATEAALACRDYGFNHLGCQRLVSLIHPQNAASRRVAEKVGMAWCRESLWKNKPICIYAIERWKSPLRNGGGPLINIVA